MFSDFITTTVFEYIAYFCITSYFLVTALLNSLSWRDSMELMQKNGIPFANFILISSIILRVVSSIFILLDIHTVFSAISLILFCIISNIIFNKFWSNKCENMKSTFILFMSCLSTIGGLILIIVNKTM